MREMPKQISKEEMRKFHESREELTIGDDEEYLINFAYSDYTGLKKLTLGKSVKKIQNGAFYGSAALAEIDLNGNKNFKMIGDCLIHKRTKRLALCIGTPHIPDGVELVNMTCFLKADTVENFVIGKDVKEIDRASRKFDIRNITLSPENEAFELESGCLFAKGTDTIVLGCSNAVIPERTTLIYSYAFHNCSFEKIVIPKNVKRIEFGAFNQCPNLSEVDLPEGLLRIEDYAFLECPLLKAVTFPASLQFYYEDSFDKGVRHTQRKAGKNGK